MQPNKDLTRVVLGAELVHGAELRLQEQKNRQRVGAGGYVQPPVSGWKSSSNHQLAKDLSHGVEPEVMIDTLNGELQVPCCLPRGKVTLQHADVLAKSGEHGARTVFCALWDERLTKQPVSSIHVAG